MILQSTSYLYLSVSLTKVYVPTYGECFNWNPWKDYMNIYFYGWNWIQSD